MENWGKHIAWMLCFLAVFIFTFAVCGKCDARTDSTYTMKNPQGRATESITPLGDWSNLQLWKSLDTHKTQASFSIQINSKLPKFNLKIIGLLKDDDFFPSYIEITNNTDGKLIQKLMAKDSFANHGGGWWRKSSFLAEIIEFVDLNNDGYLDLRVLNEAGATGNNWYATYLYKPAQNKFVYHEDLSILSAVVLDKSTGLIKTYWRSGWRNQCREYYRINKNGNLTLIKFEWTENHEDKKLGGWICYKFTGIPLDKNKIHPGYVFYHTDEEDFSKLVRKKVKIVKKELLTGDLDEKDRGPMGIPLPVKIENRPIGIEY